jgi:hypothetical protein
MLAYYISLIIRVYIMKKGAMFGLDARIALSIFGALSVISGAALYSAIQEAKAIKYLTAFEEVSKAADHYLLDTGGYLPQWGGGSNLLKIGNLYSEFEVVSGWNGPYFGSGAISGRLEVESFDHRYLNENMEANLYLAAKWSGGSFDWPESCAGSSCALYFKLCGSTSNVYKDGASEQALKIAKYLDDKVDGLDGSRSGRVRYMEVADVSTANNCVYYKHFPMTKY